VGYADVYASDRGALVIDVVFSRQRDFVNDVLPVVKTWIAAHPGDDVGTAGSSRVWSDPAAAAA
jgi:hypothetical protein